jgi:hypothetical protein
MVDVPRIKLETDAEELEKPSKKVQGTNFDTAYFRSFSDIPNAKRLAELTNAEKETSGHRKWDDFNDRKPRIPFFEARYKAVDALIRSSGVRQVVEFAAGRTTRGINNPEWNYIHTDQDPEALAQMERVTGLLTQGPRKESPHFVRFDAISGEGMEQITSALRDEPIAVVHEGLMTYYGFESKAKIASNAYLLLKRFGGVYITPDIHNNQLWAETNTTPNPIEHDRKRSESFGRDFTSMRFTTQDQALRFFSDLGFKAEIYKMSQLVPRLSSLDALFDDPEKRAIIYSKILNREIWRMTID